MKMNELSLVPSFGMSGERDQSVIIHYNCLQNSFIENLDNISIYLINLKGTKIDFIIKEIEHEIDTNNPNKGMSLNIIARIHLPDSSLQKTSDRKFDLVLSQGNYLLSVSKEAFIIYDSIVILVHGVLASSHTWNQLVQSAADKILYLKFDYEKKNNIPAIDLVNSFNDFINRELRQKGYTGRFDIVCHSMGAQITRLWMLNYPDNNNTHASTIRQWIGIAPVIHGSANADGFMTDIISSIFNWPAFSEMKTNSRTTKMLENNENYEINNSVRYRIICGYNGNKKRFFYWWFEKKFIPNYILNIMSKIGLPDGIPIPLAFNGTSKAYNSSNNVYFKTYLGDGVLANCLCLLPNASIDAFEGLNHSSIVMDQNVCDLTRNYLILNPEVNITDNIIEMIERDYQSHIKRNPYML